MKLLFSILFLINALFIYGSNEEAVKINFSKNQNPINYGIDTVKNKSNIDNYLLAVNSVNQGKDLEALEILKKISNDQRNVAIDSLKLDILFRNGMFLQAEPLIDSLIISDSLNFDLVRKKILINESNANYYNAINILEKKVETDSTNLFYLTHLGDNYKKIRNNYLSIYYYYRAYRLNSQNYYIAKKLARNYLITQPIKALDVCNNMLKNDSLNIPFLKLKAISLNRIGKRSEALNNFRQAFNLGDSSLFVLKKIGILNCKLNYFYEAEPFLKMALQHDSTDAELYFFYGCVLENSRNRILAVDTLQKALELLKPDKMVVSIIYEHIAFLYRDNKNYNESLKYYQLALENNPKKIEYNYFIASLYKNNLKNNKLALNKYNLFIQQVEDVQNSNVVQRKSNIKASYLEAAKASLEELKEEMFFKGEL